MRVMTTGGAPIENSVMDFIKVVFSIPVVQGYGLTETAANTSCTDSEDPVAVDHVGGPKAACKVRLRDIQEMGYTSQDKPYPRGELCVKGPSVFSGYYKRPEITAECFDAEGWFLTGDVA